MVEKIAKAQLLEYVAPCSLLCYTCPGFTRGIICELTNKLHNYFRGLYEFLEMNLPEEQKSRADLFKKFDENLLRYTKPNCNGCRNKPNPASRIKDCFVLECTREHGVDYCAECDAFPCSKVETLFNPVVYRRWFRGNKRIKEVGIEQFFTEEKDKSHYVDFMEIGA